MIKMHLALILLDGGWLTKSRTGAGDTDSKIPDTESYLSIIQLF